MPHIIRDVLINQNNPNIIPSSEGFKCTLYRFGFGVRFDGEEVCGVSGSVAYSGEEETGDGVLRAQNERSEHSIHVHLRALLFILFNCPLWKVTSNASLNAPRLQ